MPGDACLRSSNRLAVSSPASWVKPVAFPPGRARLETSPSATGSLASVKTIGTVRVACWAGRLQQWPRCPAGIGDGAGLPGAAPWASSLSRTARSAVEAGHALTHGAHIARPQHTPLDECHAMKRFTIRAPARPVSYASNHGP